MNSLSGRSAHAWDDATPAHRRSVPKEGARTGLFDTGLWGGRRANPLPVEDCSAAPPSLDPLASAAGIPVSSIIPRAASWEGRSSRARYQRSNKPFRGRHRGVAAATPGNVCDLAWHETLCAALVSGEVRKMSGSGLLPLRPSDLRRKVRVIHPGRLLLFLVDVSGSMGEGHMSLARRAAVLLLQKAYVKRDRVAVIAFRDQGARLLVPPTNRAETVAKALTGLACGGKTPLGAGLIEAGRVLDRADAGNPSLRSFLILISDGRGNTGSRPGYGFVLGEVEKCAVHLRGRQRLTTLFFDTTEEGKPDHTARWLTGLLGARRFVLWRMARNGTDPAVEIRREVPQG